jgi:YfiH family protein
MTVPILQAASLSALDGLRHAFFTRGGGVSTGVYASLNSGIGSQDAPENVAENRARMAGAMAVAAERLLTCYQVHSPTVVVVDEPWCVDARPRADAMVTRVAEIALGISTADCGPLLFADAEAGVIGAAHAGWRGALSGVIEATIAAMERLGAMRQRMTATLGPTISQRNYEVGPDLVERFVAEDAANRRFFAPADRAGHARFDLPGYIEHRLRRAAVATIENLGRCTYAEPEHFYSYRRATHRGEADYGRHISAIVLARPHRAS